MRGHQALTSYAKWALQRKRDPFSSKWCSKPGKTEAIGFVAAPSAGKGFPPNARPASGAHRALCAIPSGGLLFFGAKLAGGSVELVGKFHGQALPARSYR